MYVSLTRSCTMAFYETKNIRSCLVTPTFPSYFDRSIWERITGPPPYTVLSLYSAVQYVKWTSHKLRHGRCSSAGMFVLCAPVSPCVHFSNCGMFEMEYTENPPHHLKEIIQGSAPSLTSSLGLLRYKPYLFFYLSIIYICSKILILKLQHLLYNIRTES